MAQTTWLPRTNFEQPKQWLLANGEIVSEPPLEQTSTGRKVRVAGTNMSAFSKDMDALVLKAVKQFAEQKQTTVWMPLANAKAAMESRAGFSPEATKAKLHVMEDALKTTIVWWRFKHPSLPIEALLYVRASLVNQYYPNQGSRVETALVAPDGSGADLQARFDDVKDGFFSGISMDWPLREFVRDNPPSWDAADILGSDHYVTERELVKGLLAKVRKIDDLDTIQIPDTRDPDNHAWLDLELHETNLNSNLFAELTDYLEGTPSVEEALRIYEDLRACLRKIGMVLGEKSEDDFARGLAGGDKDFVTVTLNRPHEENGSEDHQHSLRMHLPSGTFVVDCQLRVNQNAIVDRWDEAHTIASLSGEEDVFLAFAREVARKEQDERAKRILRQRKGSE